MERLTSKKFWDAAIDRGIRTCAESILTFIGGCSVTGIGITDVNWLGALSAGAMGFVVSILFALKTGLPEAEAKDEAKVEE